MSREVNCYCLGKVSFSDPISKADARLGRILIVSSLAWGVFLLLGGTYSILTTFGLLPTIPVPSWIFGPTLAEGVLAITAGCGLLAIGSGLLYCTRWPTYKKPTFVQN